MIDHVVQALVVALPEWTASDIADLLWLTATAPDRIPDQAPSDAHALNPAGTPAGRKQSAPTSPPTPPRPAGKRVSLSLSTAGGAPGQGAATAATALGIRGTVASPSVGRALEVFRRVRRPGRQAVDIDATIDATADARRLVVVTSPSWEPGLEVAVVVESGPVGGAWADTIWAFEKSLWRTGAFRAVSHWSLTWGVDADGRPALTVTDASGFAHHPDRLLDPGARRLILVLTDAVADQWYDDAPWQVLRSWARVTPTAVMQLLPENYWGHTALGRPAVHVRALRAAAPNTEAEIRRAWWTEEEDEPVAGPPLPVMAMDGVAVARWARAMVTGVDWVGAVWPTPPVRPAPSTTNVVFTADDRVRAFHLRSSSEAQSLARILAGAPSLSLPLIRALQARLVPDSGPSHLAEVLVSGLLQRADSGQLLRLRPGIGELLRNGSTISEDWDVFEVLTDYLERHAGSGSAVQALLADPAGQALMDTEVEPFAAMGRAVAIRLGLVLPESVPSQPHTTFDRELVRSSAELLRERRRQLSELEVPAGRGWRPLQDWMHEVLARRPGSIADVIEILRELQIVLDQLPPASANRTSAFNALHLKVTRRVEAALRKGVNEPAFLELLYVELAKRYFYALDRWNWDDEATPDAWEVLFKRAGDGRMSRLMAAMLGVNAQINHDLPLALVATWNEIGAPTGDVVHPDYLLLTEILNQEIPPLRRGDADDWEHAAAGLVGGLDDWSQRMLNTVTRAKAWDRALDLWALRDDPDDFEQARRSMDRASALLAEWAISGDRLITGTGAGWRRIRRLLGRGGKGA